MADYATLPLINIKPVTQHTLFVCTLCRLPAAPQSPESELSGGQRLLNQLNISFADQEQIQIQPVRCMGVCNRSCVVAFAAPNKLTFVVSELTPASVPELQAFSQQYISQHNGNVPFKQRPEAIKQGIVAVLPALPAPNANP
jgi:predicted metal-binding protein